MGSRRVRSPNNSGAFRVQQAHRACFNLCVRAGSQVAQRHEGAAHEDGDDRPCCLHPACTKRPRRSPPPNACIDAPNNRPAMTALGLNARRPQGPPALPPPMLKRPRTCYDGASDGEVYSRNPDVHRDGRHGCGRGRVARLPVYGRRGRDGLRLREAGRACWPRRARQSCGASRAGSSRRTTLLQRRDRGPERAHGDPRGSSAAGGRCSGCLRQLDARSASRVQAWRWLRRLPRASATQHSRSSGLHSQLQLPELSLRVAPC